MTKNIDISDDLRLFEAFEQIGVLQKQARVYLAALALGASKIGPIARRAQEKRTTAYHHLAALKVRGLITTTKSGMQTVYVARKPGALRELLRTQERVVNYLVQKLQHVGIGASLGTVEVYEGKDMIRVLDRVLETSDTRISLIWKEAILREARGRRYYFHKKRAERGIFARVLFPRATTKTTEELRQVQHEYLADVKLLPASIDLDIRVALFDRSVALISPKEGFGIIIHSAATARLWQSLFDLLWSVSRGIP